MSSSYDASGLEMSVLFNNVQADIIVSEFPAWQGCGRCLCPSNLKKP